MPHGPQDSAPGQPITHTLSFRVAVVVISLALRLACVAERTDNTIHFKSPHRSMIVVDVRVNGMGPYPFLLDTGATSSEVDPQLSRTLALPPAQSARLASWNDTTDVRRALVGDLSFGPIDSGPLNVLVEPLLTFKAFDSHLRGVLGQDVLLRSNFLIDNRHHLIRFDNDGALLPKLTGDHIHISPVRTRNGDLEPRLISVAVQTPMNVAPLQLLLDSGADMVVLQPTAGPATTPPRGTKWIADQNGRVSSATSFHTRLSIGAEVFSAEGWIGDAGLKQLVIDGLLPTGAFSQLYIANRDCFVIFEPGHDLHKAPHKAPN